MNEQPESELNDRRFYWRQSDIRAIRDGEWKLIAYGKELDNPELFDLNEDPHENREIGAEYPDKREELLALMRRWEGRSD